jgi:restriction system protein
MAFWGVRAGKYGEGENFALENQCVVVGWDDMPDLAKFPTWEALKEGIRGTYPDISDKLVSNWAGQLWSFSKEIRKGDLIALPRKGTGTIAFGEATGVYSFDPDAAPNVRHRQVVKWIDAGLARSRVDEDILFSLGSTLTVFQVRRDEAEKRVRVLLGAKTTLPASSQISAPFIVSQEAQQPIEIRGFAVDQIRKRIGERFRGHKLALLVAAVLRAKGFEAKISPPGPDGGVDILATQGFFSGGTVNLVVQVKSEETATDAKTVRELIGVMDKYQAPRGLFVAWGGFKTTVGREFERDYFRLQFWTSDDLIREVLSNYDSFDEALKSQLPLERVWVLVQAQDYEEA